MDFEEVASRFGLGARRAEPVAVPGGLSNEVWRVRTEGGTFAVKRMVLNAARPGFAEAVEEAFAVELRAWRAGVAMPEPVPVRQRAGGRRPGALARVADGSLVRVHRWVEGEPVADLGPDRDRSPGTPVQAAALLARIHEAGRPRYAAPPDPPWRGDGWPADIRDLARRVGDPPATVLVVDSHRDLDRKNTLRRPDGTLVALDWDAAGPVSAVHEAVGVAVDWSGGDPAAFRAALAAYGRPVPAEPWIFGGWLAAQGGWLDHLAGTAGGAREVERTLHRVREMAALPAPG